MTKLKFKLKKDGKEIGRVCLAPQPDAQLLVTQNWDSVHLFVCNDRNGAECYADDMVMEDGLQWYIKWDESDLGWCLRDLAGERPPQIPDPHTITLLPDEARP